MCVCVLRNGEKDRGTDREKAGRGFSGIHLCRKMELKDVERHSWVINRGRGKRGRG